MGGKGKAWAVKIEKLEEGSKAAKRHSKREIVSDVLSQRLKKARMKLSTNGLQSYVLMIRWGKGKKGRLIGRLGWRKGKCLRTGGVCGLVWGLTIEVRKNDGLTLVGPQGRAGRHVVRVKSVPLKKVDTQSGSVW